MVEHMVCFQKNTASEMKNQRSSKQKSEIKVSLKHTPLVESTQDYFVTGQARSLRNIVKHC